MIKNEYRLGIRSATRSGPSTAEWSLASVRQMRPGGWRDWGPEVSKGRTGSRA